MAFSALEIPEYLLLNGIEWQTRVYEKHIVCAEHVPYTLWWMTK